MPKILKMIMKKQKIEALPQNNGIVLGFDSVFDKISLLLFFKPTNYKM